MRENAMIQPTLSVDFALQKFDSVKPCMLPPQFSRHLCIVVVYRARCIYERKVLKNQVFCASYLKNFHAGLYKKNLFAAASEWRGRAASSRCPRMVVNDE